MRGFTEKFYENYMFLNNKIFFMRKQNVNYVVTVNQLSSVTAAAEHTKFLLVFLIFEIMYIF